MATMERTAPAAAVRPAWTQARLFRWLVPLTAAATAVAIWVFVPNRPIVPEQPAAIQDLRVTGERGDANAAAEAERKNAETDQVPVPVPGSEPRTLKQNPAPSTQNVEPQPTAKSLDEEQAQARDEFRRERSAAESPGALGGAAAEAPAAPPPAAAAPSVSARPTPSTDTVAEIVITTERSAFRAAIAGLPESAAPSNPLIRWRAIAPASIERSTDGGKTWTRATPLPEAAANATAAFSVVAVRAVDADRAVVRTSDGRELYTTNGGLSWARVQENSKAPF